MANLMLIQQDDTLGFNEMMDWTQEELDKRFSKSFYEENEEYMAAKIE